MQTYLCFGVVLGLVGDFAKPIYNFTWEGELTIKIKKTTITISALWGVILWALAPVFVCGLIRGITFGFIWPYYDDGVKKAAAAESTETRDDPQQDASVLLQAESTEVNQSILASVPEDLNESLLS